MSSEAAFYRLSELVASVMRGSRPITEYRIVREIQRRAGVTTDRQSVRLVLMSDRRRFSTTRSRFTLFWRRPWFFARMNRRPTQSD